MWRWHDHRPASQPAGFAQEPHETASFLPNIRSPNKDYGLQVGYGLLIPLLEENPT